MPRKVLWLCSWYPNDIEPFAGDFIQRQARAVSIFLPIEVLYIHKQISNTGTAHYQKKEVSPQLTEHIFYNKVRHKSIFSSLRSRIRFFFMHIRFIRKNKKPDLIHVQVPMKSGVIALYCKWVYRIPYIVSEHYGFYNTQVDDHFRKRSFFFRLLTKWVIRNASALVTVSDSLGKDINNWVMKKKYSVISNVVNTNLFRPGAKTPRDRFRFIHVSNMIPLKNVHGIIEAAEKLWNQRKDFELLIVGEMKQEYVELARSKNLHGIVVFFEGEVSYSAVAEKVRASDSLILFSDTESQSCVVLEALCCGKPCIVTNTGGVKELIDDGINGYKVNVRDVTDLVSKMNKMMNEYESFDREKISAKTMASCSYESIGRQYANLYDEILAE